MGQRINVYLESPTLSCRSGGWLYLSTAVSGMAMPTAPLFRLPRTLCGSWEEKIGKNKNRDQRNLAGLQQLGWNVVVVWECELANATKIESLSARLPYLVERRPMEYHFDEESVLPMVAEDRLEYEME